MVRRVVVMCSNASRRSFAHSSAILPSLHVAVVSQCSKLVRSAVGTYGCSSTKLVTS